MSQIRTPLQIMFSFLLLGIVFFMPQGVAIQATHAQSSIPMIMAEPPMDEMCTYSVVFYDRDRFLPEGGSFDSTLLDLAEICGTKVIVRLHGLSSDVAAPGGGIDLVAYEETINDFAGLIDPYVANGTIVAHLTVDEPHDCSDWNNVCPATSQVDQASQISKSYWPTLKTIVNTIPVYASSYTWVHTDNINFTYAYHKGLLSDFISAALVIVNDGKANQISWGIQAFSGGCAVYGQCSMSASQVLEVGTAMCSTQRGNWLAFLSHDLTLITNEVQQAINDVRAICGDPLGPTPTPFSVTGRIFTDYNSNGVYDPTTEQPLAGVTVDLTSNGGNTVREAISDNNGTYTISALAAGNYTIDILDNTLPVGHADLNGGTQIIVGQTIALGYDFGVRVNSLSGMAFRDNNLNALYEAGSDTPYSGVEVRLTNGVGALVGTTTTDATGMYIFRGLSFDTYTLTVNPSTIDTGWASNPASRIRLVTDTSNISALDFAIQRPAGTVSGHMFADLNSNNIFDPATEQHLANATINLVAASGGTTLSRVTDSNGLYSFTNLVGGTYTITVVESTLPNGHASPVSGTINIGQTADHRLRFPDSRQLVLGHGLP